VTSEEALTAAIEQVNKLSNNARGYADGVTLPQKIDAVERLAAVLMGEAAADDIAERVDPVVTFGEHWVDGAQLDRCNLCGALVEGVTLHTDFHMGLGR
jgi:hypothetical protein